MKKIVILITIMVLTIGSAFAQKAAAKTDVAKAISQQSRRAAATVNMFTSESDNVNASDIYDMNEEFASVGYEDTAFPFAPYIATGIELSDTLYLGVIGYFHLNDDTSDLVALQPKTQTVTTYDSTYDFQIALALSDSMGIHYNFYRDGLRSVTKNTEHEVGANVTDGTEIINESFWEHELAFAMTLDNDIDFAIPLRLYFSEDKEVIDRVIDAGPTSIETTTSNIDYGSEVRLSLKPGISIPMDYEAMNALDLGVGIDFAVHTGLGLIDETISVDDGATVDTTVTAREANKDYVNLNWFISASPTLEWDLDDTVYFKSKPSLTFTHKVTSDGVTQETFVDGTGGGSNDNFTKQSHVIPAIALPLGVVYSPSDWFELRFGASYSISWTFVNGTDQDDNKTVGYSNASSFALQAGCGFIIVDDFLIDLKYGVDFSDLSVEPKPDFLDAGATLQFTYKY